MANKLGTRLSAEGWLFHPPFPAHWRRAPLYSLATWVNGLAFRDSHFTTTGKPVIKIAEIKSGITGQTKFTTQTFDEKVLVKYGDMLFSWSGQPETSIDVFWWRDREGWLNQHVFKVTPNEELDPTYFFYLLRYLKPNFVAIARNKQTTGLGHVTKKNLEEIEAAVPPLPEQKAIARILGTLDEKIELNRRMNATLEAMARALFTSWFVDFDPVHAKAAGRQPAGMDPQTAALFPDSFNSDDLPQGWRRGTVYELCEINSRTLGKKDDLDELEYVEISEVNRGDIANIATYKRGEEPSRARRRLRHGDTALSTVRPDRGSYFLALNPPEHRVASTGFAVVTPTKAPWSFVHIALTQPEVFERLGQLADGGAYPAVRPEVIGDLKLPIPDRSEILAAFHETCGPLLEQAEANRIQSRTLATLRDTLLPKLLSGKLSAAHFIKAIPD